jgi:YcaO-like protein with predicted kinase domain
MNIDNEQLNQAIATYQKYLGDSNLEFFDISSLDRIGIPIQFASFRTSDGFQNNGFGYGHNAAESLVGALGELSETFHTFNALKTIPACEGTSYQEMVQLFGEEFVIDPLTLCLCAGFPYHQHLPLRWVQVNRFQDGAKCWIPKESVAFSKYSYEMHSSNVVVQNNVPSSKLFPPITCGLGAGLSMEQALSHGILELLQRDGNCTRFRALDKGIDINLDSIQSEEIKATIHHLASLGLKVRAKLATTEFGLANLYVIADQADEHYLEQFPIITTACGEAVHPNRERALRKALHEFISSRARKTFSHGPIADVIALASADYLNHSLKLTQPHLEEPKALSEMVRWLSKSQHDLLAPLKNTMFASKNTVDFSSLPSVADDLIQNPVDRLADIVGRLAKENLPIYYLVSSPIDSDAPKVIKAIIPKLEGETISYWRIGYRGTKRLLGEGSTLVTQDPPQSQHLLIPMQESDQDALGGPVFFNIPELEKIANEHYPLYREPASHTAQKYLHKTGLVD